MNKHTEASLRQAVWAATGVWPAGEFQAVGSVHGVPKMQTGDTITVTIARHEGGLNKTQTSICTIGDGEVMQFMRLPEAIYTALMQHNGGDEQLVRRVVRELCELTELEVKE